jgi:hypothetical protein
MADKSIKFRMSLEGSETVNRQLQSVGNAGEKAIKQVQNAVTGDSFASATASISRLGSTAEQAFASAGAAAKKFGASTSELQKVDNLIQTLVDRSRASGASFAALATASDVARGVLGNVGQAAATAGGGIARFRTAATETAAAAGQLSTTVGVTSRELKFLSNIAREAGVGGLGRFVSVVGGAGVKLGALAATVAGLAAAGGTLFKFVEAAEKTTDALNTLSETGGQSFEFVSSMQQAFARGGVSLDDFAKSFGNLQQALATARPTALNDLAASADKAARATLSVKEASLQLAEAQTTAAAGSAGLTKQQQEQFTQARQALSVETAQLQLAAAQREENVARANNLQTLAGKYQRLSQGIEQTFDPLTTMESKTKALTDMLAISGQTLGRFSDGLTNLASVSEQDAAGLLKLADVFHNISSEAERMQLGKAMGLSPEFVRQLSLGSDALRRMQNDVRSLGLSLDNLDQKNIQQFKESQSTLGAIFAGLRDKMGALISPALTSFFEGLTQSLREAAPALLELARSFGQLDFSKLGRMIGEVGIAITTFFIDLAAKLSSGGGLQGAINELGETLTPVAAKVGTSMGQALFNALADSAVSGISSLAETIGKAILILPQLFVADLLKELSRAQAFVKSFLTGTPVEPPDFTRIDAAIKKLLQDAGLAGQELKTKIADPIKTISTGPIDNITRSITQIPQVATQAGVGFRRMGIEAQVWQRAAAGAGIEAQIWQKAAAGAGIEAQAFGSTATTSMKAVTVAASDTGKSIPTAISSGLDTAKTAITKTATDIGNTLAEVVGDALQGIKTPEIDWSSVTKAAQTAATDIGSAFSGIDISSSLNQQIDALITKFAELARTAAAAAAAGSSDGGGGGGGGLPFARGGLLGGRGTGTSDSNLAWLSRGEYVIPAYAVRQPGVLALLEALRRSGGNLRGVLDDMGRFARGGLVLPAFAAGGLNRGSSSSASRILNLTIEGRSFGGLSVPEATAQSLERFAVHSQIASTGRKPSWRR